MDTRPHVLKKVLFWSVAILLLLYLIAPFISGLLNYPDRRGPLIYPAAYHEILHTIGRAFIGKEGAAKSPMTERPWFYGLPRKDMRPFIHARMRGLRDSQWHTTSTPNSNAEFLVDFGLVDSATNIYLYAGGSQFLDRFIRLTVKPADVAEQIRLIASENNEYFDYVARSLPCLTTNLASAEIVEPVDTNGETLKLSWWMPENITNGFFFHETESNSLQVWADTNNGTLFIHQGD